MDQQNPIDLDQRIRKSNTEKQLTLRRENATYLEQHPEIRMLLSQYTRRVFDERPMDLMEHAVAFFCQADLKNVVKRNAAPKVYLSRFSVEEEEEKEEEDEVEEEDDDDDDRS